MEIRFYIDPEYAVMSTVTLYEGCAYDVLRDLLDKGVRVHSVICDPPYFLESIAKRFGSATAAAAKFGDDGAFTRAGMRFTGKKWDAADDQGRRISFDPEFWRLVFDLLLPGGYVAAFASPRTGHWQAMAMELAGFDMHPFKGWAYASGLAKQHPCDKAIRRLGGSKEEAEKWAGWAYGAQAEKPALEPIYIAQRPFSEKNGPANLRMHGVGAINIEASRVTVGNGKTYHPANLLHDGSVGIADLLGGHAEMFHAFGHVEDERPLLFNGKANKRDRAGSNHPSVKPVALLRNLVRQYTPPGGIVLDPFGGSGTTGEAARLEGFDCILVERDADYVGDICHRFSITPGGHHRAASLDDLM